MVDWMPSPRPAWETLSPATGAGPAGTAAQRDALSLIRDTLSQYGLPDSLAAWAWSEIQAGKGNAEILLDLRQRPEFKARFPAIDAREKAGLPPLSPAEYVSYEQTAAQMFRAAGLPEGFYDSPDDFTKFLTNDVSVKELSDRVDLARQAAFQAPQEVRDALRRIGVGDGDMTAYFLDETRAVPLLQRNLAAAGIAGAARRTGVGTSLEQDFRLADLGVSAEQAQAGFSALGQQRELFTPLAGHAEDAITLDEQLGAAFEGNSDAARKIERRRRSRVAEFQGGGSYAAGARGVSAFGSATT